MSWDSSVPTWIILLLFPIQAAHLFTPTREKYNHISHHPSNHNQATISRYPDKSITSIHLRTDSLILGCNQPLDASPSQLLPLRRNEFSNKEMVFSHSFISIKRRIPNSSKHTVSGKHYGEPTALSSSSVYVPTFSLQSQSTFVSLHNCNCR